MAFRSLLLPFILLFHAFVPIFGRICKSKSEYECVNADFCFAEYAVFKDNSQASSSYGCGFLNAAPRMPESTLNFSLACDLRGSGCSDIPIFGINRTAKLCCCRDRDNCNNKWITESTRLPSLQTADMVVISILGVSLLVCFGCVIWGVKRDERLKSSRKSDVNAEQNRRLILSPSAEKIVKPFFGKTIPKNLMVKTPMCPLILLLCLMGLQVVWNCLTELFFWIPYNHQCCKGLYELKEERGNDIECPDRWMIAFLMPVDNFRTLLKHIIWWLPVVNLCDLYLMFRYIRVSFLRKSDPGRALLLGAGVSVILSVIWGLAGGLNLWSVLNWISDKEYDCKPSPSLWIAFCTFAVICAVLRLMEVGALFFLLYAKKKLTFLKTEKQAKTPRVFGDENSVSRNTADNIRKFPTTSSSNSLIELLKKSSSGEVTVDLNECPRTRTQKLSHRLQKKKVELNMKKEPLIVDPGFLEFFAPPKTKIQSRSFKVTSQKKRPMVFKVLTNQPFCYSVKPNSGFIPPEESIEITVEHRMPVEETLGHPSDQGPKKPRILLNHGQQQLLILSAVLPENLDVSKVNRFYVWTIESAVGPSDKWIRKHVPIWFVPPSRIHDGPSSSKARDVNSEQSGESTEK